MFKTKMHKILTDCASSMVFLSTLSARGLILVTYIQCLCRLCIWDGFGKERNPQATGMFGKGNF